MDTVDSMIKATCQFITKNHLMHYISSLKVSDISREMEEIEKYIESEDPDIVDSIDFWDLMRTKLAMDMLGV